MANNNGGKNTGATKTEYKEIGRAYIGGGRWAVISECSKGGYTIAQQIENVANGEPTSVFLRGAIHVSGDASLRALCSTLVGVVKQINDAADFVVYDGIYDDEWPDDDSDASECPVVDNEASEVWDK